MDFRENAKEPKPKIKLQDAKDEDCSLHEICEDARKVLLFSQRLQQSWLFACEVMVSIWKLYSSFFSLSFSSTFW